MQLRGLSIGSEPPSVSALFDVASLAIENTLVESATP